jgi:hypothetical protein
MEPCASEGRAAAIVGQLAGAFYGASTIPAIWQRTVYLSEAIRSMASRLLEAAGEDKIAAFAKGKDRIP